MTTESEFIRKFLRSGNAMSKWLLDGVASGRIGDSDSIDPDEEMIVLAGPDPGGIEGSKQTKCGCGAVVWLSPSTQEMMAKRAPGRTIVKCLDCVLKEAQP